MVQIAKTSEQTAALLSVEQRMLIGSDFVASTSGQTIPVLDPATESQISTLASGNAQDVDLAVNAARAAFESRTWRKMEPALQSLIIDRLAKAIEDEAEQLAYLETIDSGKPHVLAREEVLQAASFVRYYAGWPTKIYGTVNPVPSDLFSYSVREPIGVVAGIVPWNCPLINAVYKVVPAIACGNSVILKPAEQTSLTALRLGQLCLEVGVPPGVVQVVTGFGESVGDALVTHPGVDKIAFTGSTETGRRIARRGADTLKQVSLELGGKSPAIVFADADLDAAVERLFSPFGVWYSSGQICVQASRLLVQREVADEFVEAAIARTAALCLGSPFDASTELGPLVSSDQLSRVLGYLSLASDEGANVLIGGRRVDRPGYFVEPTILSGMLPGMRIANEEIFGPVVGVMPFGTEDEAVSVANDTDFGLAASIWTSNISRGHTMVDRLRSGVVWINSFADTDPSVSFGGTKQSGYGRECGEESIRTYTQTKSVYCRL